MNINKFSAPPFIVPFSIFIFSTTALAIAYFVEYFLEIEPCLLCLYQRIPYFASGVLGLVALITSYRRVRVVEAAGVIFGFNATIAFYHLGVEQHWWMSVIACGAHGGDVGAKTVEELQQLLLTGDPVKACDNINWSLFGFSMATYNVIVSLILSVGSFFGAYKIGAYSE
jgi:disulfide bond formation protein DsbB|tara:strand:- start:1016 stop:1525 length:510 start_codon:yes stop_codon:yes gene_type:complete